MKDPINTLQELERNSKTPTDGCAPSPVHTAEWLAAFGAQATQRTMDNVAAYVAKRATWLRAQHGAAAPDVINALVSDALGDTFAKAVTWDPLKCSLALHLRSVIRSRLSHELERNEDHPHVDIEATSEHEVNEALLSVGTTTPTKRIGRYVKEFTEQLRAAAGNDLAVLTLIDLHLQDITERRQICHISGMKPGAYHNAFRRLKRLADKLPAELRAAAVEELSEPVAGASGPAELPLTPLPQLPSGSRSSLLRASRTNVVRFGTVRKAAGPASSARDASRRRTETLSAGQRAHGRESVAAP